ncbi:sugar transferase [candidate division TA06 bacterium]|uniref:Sugar transferase n=1 Tax=candidate division TA06 bacterium TaxID=2250710 RepID=A0A933IA83_UNCT6|nr:sugar transferase [candidate division TA06 bacterium]
MKRLFDIMASCGALIFLLPLMALVALAIIIDSRGGALFLQERTGLNGKPFKIFKFRTMVPNVENKGPLLAVRNDLRVTRVGKFLRRWSLDELPQLFNIIKGDMSLIGPRPEIPALEAEWSLWQRKVLQVRPGLSGFAQIMGRDDLPIDTKLRLDSYYIRHMSFCFDLWIIWRTLVIVLTGRGAF